MSDSNWHLWEKPLYTEKEIYNTIINDLGPKISNAIEDDANLTLLPVMNGAALYFAELAKSLFARDKHWVLKKSREVFYEMIRLRSPSGSSDYFDHSASGQLQLDVFGDHIEESQIKDRTILIIDTLSTTGRTMFTVAKYISQFLPKKILATTLLKKESSVQTHSAYDLKSIPGFSPASETEDLFVGFHVADYKLVGYGLDYRQKYRLLKGIYILPDDLTHPPGDTSSATTNRLASVKSAN